MHPRGGLRGRFLAPPVVAAAAVRALGALLSVDWSELALGFSSEGVVETLTQEIVVRHLLPHPALADALAWLRG